MSILFSSIILLVGVLISKAAFHGDEIYGNLKGLFYVFASDGIYTIDPFAKNISKILNVGSPSWGDAVYIRNQAQTRHLVYASDATNYKMIVIDAVKKNIISIAKAAARVIHVYAVTSTDEVWGHSDVSGVFDVFHLNAPEYRANTLVPSKVTTKGGHGKLVLNYRSLGAKALTSNVAEPYFATIDLQSKKQIDTFKLPCSGSHGLGSSDINGHYYVQCIGINATMFEIDPNSRSIVNRFTSAYLNKKDGVVNSGVLGQQYLSPDETFFIVPNPKGNVIAILKPTPTGTKILEIPMSYNPGSTIYYPKDTSVTFGTDPNPRNYWAVIALEEKSANGGVAFLDMAVVVDGFNRNVTILDASVVTYLPVGPGKGDRPIARGNDFVATPVMTGTTATDTTQGSISLINIKTKAIVASFNIPAISRVIWVPTHTDELGNSVSTLQTQVDSLAAATPSSGPSSCDCDNTRANQAIIIGSVGLFTGFIALVAIVLSMIWIGDSKKNLAQVPGKDVV